MEQDRHETLLELERSAWRALSSDRRAAASFYDEVLADDVLMLLPGGTVIDDRDDAIRSMGGSPWASYQLADERVFDLSDEGAVVTYRATAERDGVHYEALCASTYVQCGDGWRLALHQQTPI